MLLDSTAGVVSVKVSLQAARPSLGLSGILITRLTLYLTSIFSLRVQP